MRCDAGRAAVALRIAGRNKSINEDKQSKEIGIIDPIVDRS